LAIETVTKIPLITPQWSFGVDHVEFYLENIGFWREWFEDCLDFKSVGQIFNNTHTEILQHGSIEIRLSAPIDAKSPVAEFLQHHPPGIAAIAFRSNTASTLVPTWSRIEHRFVCQKSSQASSQDSGFDRQRSANLFTHIDHVVINVPKGEMQSTARWYEQNLGLWQSDRFEIQTLQSALRSVVLESQDRTIQIPINEPSTANSQIQEFLDWNRGAGVQHLALHTHDIYSTVAKLKQRGVKFLETAPAILADTQDPETGQVLLQIFTQPIFAQPTFFFEIIQRQNRAQGFGEGNFQSLFEAIEREQMSRASL